MLLAVDLGLRTGLACYDTDGRLQWYRSQHFGTVAKLKRGAYGLLRQQPALQWLVMEGGGDLARVWQRLAEKRGLQVLPIDAQVWRQDLLLPREQRNGPLAKQHADTLARQVIEWSGASRPTALRHDAAEAILVGLWGAWHLGWLETLPLRR